MFIITKFLKINKQTKTTSIIVTFQIRIQEETCRTQYISDCNYYHKKLKFKLIRISESEVKFVEKKIKNLKIYEFFTDNMINITITEQTN